MSWYLIFEYHKSTCKILADDDIFGKIIDKYFKNVRDLDLIELILEDDNIDLFIKYDIPKKYINPCMNAAKHDAINILKYLHQNKYEWDSSTCAMAAENNSLRCLRYIHENGCLWNYRTPRNAAKNGNVECLKYALDNCCSWDISMIMEAAKHGHLNCLKYFHMHILNNQNI